METGALTKRQKAKLKMLRYLLRVTRMGKIRSDYIIETTQVNRFGEIQMVWVCAEDGLVAILEIGCWGWGCGLHNL